MPGQVKGNPYLIFVLFFTQAKFLENKIYTEKLVNYDKLHSKLPILQLNYGNLSVNGFHGQQYHFHLNSILFLFLLICYSISPFLMCFSVVS